MYRLTKLAAGCGLLALLVYMLDWQTAVAALRHAGPHWIAAAFLVSVLGVLISADKWNGLLRDSRIGIGYPNLLSVIRPGSRILIADGLIELLVIRIEGGSAICQVGRGGVLPGKQGVTLPGASIWNVWRPASVSWVAGAEPR